MIELGYALSSEERTPVELVENARAAEQAGFRFALISDHFHPWIGEQAESPFVWDIVGPASPAPTKPGSCASTRSRSCLTSLVSTSSQG